MSDGRDAVPLPLKRDVRKRCYFGCVLCGCPVYHYDHIEKYADVLEHAVENITLLCPTHHQDKNSGRLSAKRVQAATASPFNAGRSHTSVTDTYYDLDVFSIEVGGICMKTDLSERGYDKADVLNVDGATVIGVRRDAGDLSLWLRLCDASNEPYVDVRNGEIKLSTNVWDATYEGTLLTIRDGKRDIRLELDLSPSALRIVRARFSFNGFDFRISPEIGFEDSSQKKIIKAMSFEGGGCMFYKGAEERMPDNAIFNFGEGDRSAPC